MRITDVNVDGFGVWRNLSLAEMTSNVTVFYGPNEAGKTTLMQFIRAVLYGVDDERRRHYLSSVNGGVAGGTLHVAGSAGQFAVERRGPVDKITDADVNLVASDGSIQGGRLLRTLLLGIDEATFNNVFAVGLREMQELATLTDTDAASLLYSLTTGLDRVSLVDVMRELKSSRTRILADGDQPSQIGKLLIQRNQLANQAEQLEGNTRRWTRGLGRGRQLQAQAEALDAESQRLARDGKAIETALAVQDKWNRRARLDEQLAELGSDRVVSADALDRLELVVKRLAERGERRRQIRQRRKEVRDEAEALTTNDVLWRQGPRIEALGEQQQWVAALERQIDELRQEVETLEAQWQTERHRMGLVESVDDHLPDISDAVLGRLRPTWRIVRDAKQRTDAAATEAAQARAAADAADAEITAALTSQGAADLPTALDGAGNRVAQLRRRVALDERLEKMERQKRELEEQSVDSLEGQILPVWFLAAVGSSLVVAVLLIFLSYWLSSTAAGVCGGLLAAVAVCAGLTKFLIERSAASKLEACGKQLELLAGQIEQATQERDALDRGLPSGGGALVSRLQAAQRELAVLEEISPREARRQTNLQLAAAAEAKHVRARQELVEARKAWQKTLAALGLPEDLSPSQIRQLAGGSRRVGELRRQLDRRKEELQGRVIERDTVANRVAQLRRDVGDDTEAVSLTEQIRSLVASWQLHESHLRRREQLRAQTRSLRSKEARYDRNLAKLRLRRDLLLREAQCENEEEYRRQADRFCTVRDLRRDRDALTAQIESAADSHVTPEELTRLLTGGSTETLENRWEQLSTRLETCTRQRTELAEEIGALKHQQQALAGDRSLAECRLELAVVDGRLADALHAWRVQATTGMLLDWLRSDFEQHRQPETLIEASGFLQRLTEGRYTRVWTPLGEEVLYVVDNEEQSWPVEVLSRGTREQLFLALRLALVAQYARRGAVLPLVLDDVLVNFDTQRAKAAAAVLCDFAKAGHQILVFTCHEHIWKIFKSAKADVRRLPSRGEVDAAALPEPVEIEAVDQPSEPEIPAPILLEQPAEEFIEEDEIEAEAEVELDVDEDEEYEEYEEDDEEEEDEFEYEYEEVDEDEGEGEDEEYEVEDEDEEEVDEDEQYEEYDEDEEEEDEYDDEYVYEVVDGDEEDEEEETNADLLDASQQRRKRKGARGWEVELEEELKRHEDESEAA